MNEGGLFYQAFIYLTAAVISVPIAKKLGLGSVLGYLFAGIIIGPFVLGLAGEEGQDVMHFAEFGVVMMLFLIGLELQPALLWKLKGPILGMGGLQVGLTASLIMVIGIFLGLSWQMALAIGLTLALSSTAIVLQTLNEKGLIKTPGGQNAFSVLLFQDIAVIPILAIFPLLATIAKSPAPAEGGGHHATNWIEGFPIWAQTLMVFAVVVLIIVAGRYFISPAFRLIAKTRLRELFTAAALLLIIGIALLMTKVGLSPALGTFMAGVVLAQSEYRHELEIDIEPFKGLLLGLFFIAVGASLDFDLIRSQPGLIVLLVAMLMAVKFVVLFVLGRVFRMGLDQNLLFAFALAQGGEFAYVLFSFATQNGVISPDTVAPLVAVVAISMALTPIVMLVNEKLDCRLHRIDDFAVHGKEQYYILYEYQGKESQRMYYLLYNRHQEGWLFASLKGIDAFFIIQESLSPPETSALLSTLRKGHGIQAAYEIRISTVKDFDLLLQDLEVHLMNTRKRKEV